MADQEPGKPGCIGQICWLQVPVIDSTRARDFYTEILGWECPPDPVQSDKSGVKAMHFFNKGHLHGAFTVMNEGYQITNHKDGVQDALPVLPTFNVQECNETLDKVKGLGGKVQCPKTAIGGEMGHYARFIDTEGNMIGIWSQN
ncbi:hypothetical protein PT974_11534 [Cladobotryum mycophilum]|uniref:VOC domain-containing protein n=1 Tax=Cladobotryum mycophilum TaxID=491253 RepID=A0ABR0S6C5_9HYPO